MASQLSDKRRVNALFRALGSDYLFREQFVTDPAQILTEYVRGRPLERDQADAANQLIFAMVSNAGMLEWLSSYGRTDRGQSDEEFAGDLARALAKHGDEQVQLAVLRAAGESADMLTIEASVLRGMIAALSKAGRPVFGTEMSSPGTEMSPGRVFAGTEMSSPGTEISSPGTEVSTPGTEISSPGTEISSPGTEVSTPGRFGGIDIEATIAALVDFARELRRAGALDTLRFR
jgi:hypothetical protein